MFSIFVGLRRNAGRLTQVRNLKPVTRMNVHLPVDCPTEKATWPRDSGATVGPRVYPAATTVSWSLLEDLPQVCKLINLIDYLFRTIERKLTSWRVDLCRNPESKEHPQSHWISHTGCPSGLAEARHHDPPLYTALTNMPARDQDAPPVASFSETQRGPYSQTPGSTPVSSPSETQRQSRPNSQTSGSSSETPRQSQPSTSLTSGPGIEHHMYLQLGSSWGSNVRTVEDLGAMCVRLREFFYAVVSFLNILLYSLENVFFYSHEY